jgi:hypothetical protein
MNFPVLSNQMIRSNSLYSSQGANDEPGIDYASIIPSMSSSRIIM